MISGKDRFQPEGGSYDENCRGKRFRLYKSHQLNNRTILGIAKELNVLGADIVEVSPPYDGPGEQTAYLANRIVMEILNGMAERKLV